MSESSFIKVIIAGDGACGKTTLLYRYVQGNFLTNTKMTLGVDFMLKELTMGRYHITLQIWDFGGQAHFRHLLQQYSLGAQGALLVFDLTRVNTLNNIEEWVSICRKYNKELPILLLGAKLDLEDDIKVDDDYIEKIKDSYNLFHYLKVSSKSGINVSESFDILTEVILKKSEY